MSLDSVEDAGSHAVSVNAGRGGRPHFTSHSCHLNRSCDHAAGLQMMGQPGVHAEAVTHGSVKRVKFEKQAVALPLRRYSRMKAVKRVLSDTEPVLDAEFLIFDDDAELAHCAVNLVRAASATSTKRVAPLA